MSTSIENSAPATSASPALPSGVLSALADDSAIAPKAKGKPSMSNAKGLNGHAWYYPNSDSENNDAEGTSVKPDSKSPKPKSRTARNKPNAAQCDNFTIEEFRQLLEQEGIALRYNPLADSVEMCKGDGEYSELDGPTEAYLITQIPLRFHNGKMAHKISSHEVRLMRDTIAAENSVNPFLERIDALEWDGQPRLGRLFSDSLRLKPTAYLEAVSRLSLCAIAARQYEPGIKFDYMFVLLGAQGIGKTVWVYNITDGKYHTDGVNLDLDEEEFGRSLQGCVTGEAAEIVRSTKRGIERDKSIITRRVDRYRRKFTDRYVNKPRQCVLFGTVNPGPGGPLSYDPSGQRRYLIVDCDAVADDCSDPARRYDHIMSYWAANRDQLFAEAVALYKAGISLELPRELWAEQEKMARAEAPDPDAELVTAITSAASRLPNPHKVAFSIKDLQIVANEYEKLELDAVSPRKLGDTLRHRLKAIERGHRKFVLPNPEVKGA